MNIPKSAWGLVEQIFGIAVAIHAARYAHVVPINIQLSCAIGKCKRNLSKADRLARIGAIENDIGHFIAAERLGGLLPEHPAHGIEHVRLAAAIRADNGGNALVKAENRFIGERFEAKKFERL